jgi:hypothetical protein
VSRRAIRHGHGNHQARHPRHSPRPCRQDARSASPDTSPFSSDALGVIAVAVTRVHPAHLPIRVDSVAAPDTVGFRRCALDARRDALPPNRCADFSVSVLCHAAHHDSCMRRPSE